MVQGFRYILLLLKTEIWTFLAHSCSNISAINAFAKINAEIRFPWTARSGTETALRLMLPHTYSSNYTYTRILTVGID